MIITGAGSADFDTGADADQNLPHRLRGEPQNAVVFAVLDGAFDGLLGVGFEQERRYFRTSSDNGLIMTRRIACRTYSVSRIGFFVMCAASPSASMMRDRVANRHPLPQKILQHSLDYRQR